MKAASRRHIRAAALAHYFEVAEAAGLNPQPLLRRAGLSRRMLVDPEQRIPLAAALQLLEESAEASGLADFGLRMAQARRLSDLGALGLLLTHLSSLRAVLQTLIHSRQLVGGTVALAMVEAGKSTVIREDRVGPAAARSRQATDSCWASCSVSAPPCPASAGTPRASTSAMPPRPTSIGTGNSSTHYCPVKTRTDSTG